MRWILHLKLNKLTINIYFMMYSEYENDAWKCEEIIFVKGNRIKCPLS